MALRVLLADESTTIKKVLQLALQDFGVEVKAVPASIDVLPVSKSWKPDIIFADVLLPKKSGYEVCTDIKADPSLSNTPVVLLWSNFMKIDEAKASTCHADGRLEKPFDAETLRSLVKSLVPSLGGNKISEYLSFPHLPEIIDNQPMPPPAPVPTSAPTPAPTLDEEPEDFKEVPLSNLKASAVTPTPAEEPWSVGNLDRFKIQIPKDDYSMSEDGFENIEESPIAVVGSQDVQLSDLDEPRRMQPRSTSSPATMGSLLDPAMAEQIMREQMHEVLQEVAWKLIPDIVERVVKEQIEKLLKDAEKLS